MDSVQNIITNIFGGELTFQSIANAIVPLYAVVMSIKEAIATRRLIKADKELNATEKKVGKLQEETTQVREAIGILGDMICTAYLANPNVDEQTKKKLAVAATKLDEVAKIPLAEMSRGLIDTVTKYVPGTNLEAKKEAIVAEVAKVEEKIDDTVEDISDIVKNLEVYFMTIKPLFDRVVVKAIETEEKTVSLMINVYEGADAVQQPVGRVGDPRDIANMVLYLCSDMAGFITGENICVDGGMTRQMIYHGDFGWSLEKK